MPCACDLKNQKFVVYLPSGAKYKEYRTKIEADAAAKRVNGSVKTK
jgi:hypothetical protein